MKNVVSVPWVIVAGGIWVLILTAGCEPDRPLAPPNHLIGHKVYYGYCSGCHESGNDKVPTLREKRYLPQYTSDAQMLKSIRDGKGNMPPQGGMLKDEDLKEGIRYIRYMQRQEAKKKRKKKD